MTIKRLDHVQRRRRRSCSRYRFFTALGMTVEASET